MSTNSESTRKVIILQLVVAIIWGATWVAGRVASAEAPALVVAGWRVALAMLTLGILVWKKEGKIPLLPSPMIPTIFLMGLLGVFAYAVCFFYGLKHIPAGQGALVVALNPVIVALASCVFMGERLNRKKILGIFIALIGSLIVLGKGDPISVLEGHVSLGQALILGCVVLWTIYTLLGRHASSSVSSLVMTFYATVVGGILLIGLGLIEGSLRIFPAFSYAGWFAMFFLGVLGSALAYVWYAQGLKVLGATRTAIFINLVPVSAVILSAVILKESIDPMTLVGGVLIISGVALTNHIRRGI
ncbi:MAG: DMT family transporter [Pseudomonadota bacterium]